MGDNRKILILCGGTGGHFHPGLTVAREIRGGGGEARLLLSGKHSEKQVETTAEFDVPSSILPKLPPPIGVAGKFRFAAAFLGAWLAARRMLKDETPDAILAMGSFTSLPAALAAVSLGIPLYLHDGNARIGKANRFLSRFARTLFLSYPPVNASAIHCQTAMTGMPTRPELAPSRWTGKTKEELLNEFNAKFAAEFTPERPTLLIFGGSQGAATFNKKLPELLKELDVENWQIIHLAGFGYAEETAKRYSDSSSQRLVVDESPEMGLLYALADCVVCRAGGSTVAELALFAKFAVLIPFPHASERHQDDNADYYLSSNAGVKFDDDQVGSSEFIETLRSILAQPAKFAELGREAAKLAKPDAARLLTFALIG